MTRLRLKPSTKMLADRVYSRRFAKCANCKHTGDAAHQDLCKECIEGKKKMYWESVTQAESK